jgi:hypothetical protein
MGRGAAAMRQFRGILGFGTVTESGGTAQGSHEADGELVDSIRIQDSEP